MKNILVRFITFVGSTGAVLFALGLWAIPAQAQVIFSNFDANQDLAGSGNDWCVSGTTTVLCGPATLREIAQLAPNPAGTVPLGSIALALGCNSGTNGVIVSLAQ